MPPLYEWFLTHPQIVPQKGDLNNKPCACSERMAKEESSTKQENDNTKKDLYRLVFESINHPVFVVDEELNYLLWNRRYISSLDLISVDALQGKNYSGFHTKKQIDLLKSNIDTLLKIRHTQTYKHFPDEEKKLYYLRVLNLTWYEKNDLIIAKDLTEFPQNEGIIPICSNCKKIRDPNERWMNPEDYLRIYKSLEFSHGICPDCAKKLYKDHIATE